MKRITALAVKGEFVHHIRYPWGPDSAQWRPDESRAIATPSICVIPPPTIHKIGRAHV